MRERRPLKVERPEGAASDAPAARRRALRPEQKPERQAGHQPGNRAADIRHAARGQGFASDGRRRRSLHTGTIAFKVRPGMSDLLEDICYLRRLKKQELFEEMLAAWLDAADTPELAAKYRRIMGQD